MSIIEIKNLWKVFKDQGTAFTALRDVNLDIECGEVFGIIGLSGAGKSTLVRMINFLEKPTRGIVKFEGEDLSKLSEKKLRLMRREIGMIFQNFNLLEQSTVIENVLFPLEIIGSNKKQSIERARELLKLVDLSEKEKVYPSKLSGGQKQRVAIARALATKPKVLLCDEATSALDPKTTIQILDLLKRINRELGVTVVIITHQMNVIDSICDRVAIIDNSQIEEIGDVREVFRAPKSLIGKKLIFGATANKDIDFVKAKGKDYLRLAFDGSITDEPILANMILETKLPVSIVYANTRAIDNKIIGQLVIEMPDDKSDQTKMKEYLEKKGITCLEVRDE